MQQKADAEADKRKGFALTIDGEPIHLPLVYGHQKIGGVRTYHSTSKSVSIPAVSPGFSRFASGLTGTSFAPKTEEFLFIQQAFCFGGIDSVTDIEVDGINWDDGVYKHVLDFSLDGGVANPFATGNGIPATNRFSNIAHMTGLFRLNRDDPNYNGIPEVTAYVRGNKVHSVVLSGSEYSLSPTKSFSDNPSLVLLDYLIRPKKLGGCGYDPSEVYLKSFYDSALICNTVVAPSVSVSGRINGVRPVAEGVTPATASRNIRLYECNIILDTSETRRDNIERILETMAQSELIWSEGQYKLVLDYPSDEASQDALVTASYTDDDIVSGDINVSWAGVENRFNRATVKFLNEEQDYATDSVSWPIYGSVSHLAYLADDNNIENEIEYFIQGATHYKSALAKAEELVRNSRISKVLDLELDRKALIHEQGDLIKISSASAGIVDEVYRIEEIGISDKLSVRISMVRFDYQTLAYNVSSTVITNPKVVLPAGVPNVSGLVWNAGSRIGDLSNGWLSWTPLDDDSIRRFLVYKRLVSGSFEALGESRTNFFDIPAELDDGTSYYFMVRSESTSGRLSEGVIILVETLSSVIPIVGGTVDVGINSVTLHWDNPNSQLARQYDILKSDTNLRADAVKIGTALTTSFVVSPLTLADHYFWVDVVSKSGTIALMSSPIVVSSSALGIKPGDILANTIAFSKLDAAARDLINDADAANAALIAAAQSQLDTFEALTEADFDSLSSSVAASIGTISASVDTNAAALATLDGYAAATQTFRVVAGSAGASVELVAADDPIAGTASAAIISAKNIELKASSVRISNAGNIYPDFDLIDSDFYSTPDTATYSFSGNTEGSLGAKHLSIGVNAALRTVVSKWVPIDSDTEYKVSAAAWLAASGIGAGTSTVYFETGTLDGSTGIVTATSRYSVVGNTDASFSSTTSFGSLIYTNGSTERAARFVVERSAGGTEAGLAGAFKIEKKSDSTLIVDGSIFTDHLSANTVTTEKMSVEWLNAGRLSATYIDVDGLLTILPQAGLRYQKDNAYDAVDGLYFGLDTDVGFGLAASRTSVSGSVQSIELTEDTGLKIKNAKHYVSGIGLPTVVNITANQGPTALPAGIKIFKLSMAGGGAGGQGAATAYPGTLTNGTAGGTTTVKIYDGVTLLYTWTAAGAPTGSPGSYFGQASAFAAGGAQALSFPGAGGHGSRGSGGGGAYTAKRSGDNQFDSYGLGGKAGTFYASPTLDLSGLAAPKIEVTLGGGGAGGNSTVDGGNGGAGFVTYNYAFAEELQADVVPLKPTATGSFVSSGSAFSFPALGAGFWVLSSNSADLALANITISPSAVIYVYQNRNASFHSSQTPTVTTGSAVRTINYVFYSMGSWG